MSTTKHKHVSTGTKTSHVNTAKIAHTLTARSKYANLMKIYQLMRSLRWSQISSLIRSLSSGELFQMTLWTSRFLSATKSFKTTRLIKHSKCSKIYWTSPQSKSFTSNQAVILRTTLQLYINWWAKKWCNFSICLKWIC